jgi:methylated-DNA-[protein]-cysteine S-methyltransferase
VLDRAARELDEYLAGTRRSFDLPLAPRGTPFQRAVWEALTAIPYGTTATYAQLATAVGRPAAVRAVGQANGRNPIAVVVPCHRVVGADGSLTGYAGGTDRKAALLDLERRVTATG